MDWNYSNELNSPGYMAEDTRIIYPELILLVLV